MALATRQEPLLRRLRQHADSRLDFETEDTQANRLSQLRAYLRLENEMMVRYHRKGDSGRRVCLARTLVMDVLIERLFEGAIEQARAIHGERLPEVGLVALGGYGRCELSPFSDIDLMFLYPNSRYKDRLQSVQQTLTDAVLYPLWDLRLKVGHSSRTIREALEEGHAEIQSRNALLEARLICGSSALFERFKAKFARQLRREDTADYVASRLEDQQKRREKFGGTVYLQEPDIKNGVGGLRDYQNIIWMAHIRVGSGTLDELVKRHYLSKNEQSALETAYDFLLRVRNELHFQSSRATDLLNLEKQPQIAYQLGYVQEDVFRRVEAFMRHYYSHARNIFQISRIVEQRLALTGMPGKASVTFREAVQARRAVVRKQLDGFILTDGELQAQRDDIFREDPVRLLRLFRYLQQFNARLDLRLHSLIGRSLSLLTPRIRNSQPAVRSFLGILSHPGEVFEPLSQMHELGVLGRFMPEFGDLTCLVQHEYYHRYTADIHTLKTIKVLDEVFAGTGDHPPQYARHLRETEDPPLLYLMLLLHDLGKAHGTQGHQESGVKIAGPILERLGLDSAVREKVRFNVGNHLEMARFWQRHDLDNPRTAEAFARFVGSAERLRYLFALTYCDAQGTASGLWNAYKDSLHMILYDRTFDRLQSSGQAATDQEEKRQMLYQDFLSREVPGVSREEVEAHFSLLPERYFLHNSAADVELHLKMIHQLLTHISESHSVGSLVPVIDWRDDLDESMTVVNVVTWDRAGLFYKLAGAFTVAGLNILSTKAISRTDHITIDTFYVIEPGGGPSQNREARAIFEDRVEQSLLRNVDLLPEITERAHRSAKPAYLKRSENLQAPLPATVDVYHELSLRRTIIEITATDSLGLLYRLARTIFDHGYDISFARISTERDVALDTFYIEKISARAGEPSSNGRGTEAHSLVALRDDLTRIISEENGSSASLG
ncbi:MAG: [protein-PII] uridylyltransferase [Opitutales bacterium]